VDVAGHRRHARPAGRIEEAERVIEKRGGKPLGR